ncbi:hypothetical protein MAR_033550 [Mya arenaria]|uniref:Uncharacterized protein n=1 Tax=Mya arenaria TaxID=6604 RepID=A0ABY7G996_MYAAR|nr:hypothetical protein MAR_033550 [Mya arenaria]
MKGINHIRDLFLVAIQIRDMYHHQGTNQITRLHLHRSARFINLIQPRRGCLKHQKTGSTQFLEVLAHLFRHVTTNPGSGERRLKLNPSSTKIQPEQFPRVGLIKPCQDFTPLPMKLKLNIPCQSRTDNRRSSVEMPMISSRGSISMTSLNFRTLNQWNNCRKNTCPRNRRKLQAIWKDLVHCKEDYYLFT